MTAGSLTVDTPEGSVELVTGDYGLLPVGSTHAFRNTSDRAGVVLGDEGAAPAGTVRLRHPVSPAARCRDRSGRSTFVTRATATSDTSTPSRWTRQPNSGPAAGECEHAYRLARVQRDLGQDDGRLRPRRRPLDDVHGAVRAGRVRRRPRPPARGDVSDPRRRGGGVLRRERPTSSGPATWPGPVSAASTSSATSARDASAGWRRRPRSHHLATPTALPGTGDISTTR